MRCRVIEIEPWWCDGRHSTAIEIAVAADGFLPRMVRNIVGTLVEIGRGDEPAIIMETILASRDRRQALGTAPPHGLTLWRVGYDGDTHDE
jgi:tRNA pseudouridine38-40 synthase